MNLKLIRNINSYIKDTDNGDIKTKTNPTTPDTNSDGIIDGWQDKNKNGAYNPAGADNITGTNDDESDAVIGFYDISASQDMISPGKLNLSFMPEELIGISMANGDCFEQGNCQPFNHNELIYNIGSQTATQYQISINPQYIASLEKKYIINESTNSFYVDIYFKSYSLINGSIKIIPLNNYKTYNLIKKYDIKDFMPSTVDYEVESIMIIRPSRSNVGSFESTNYNNIPMFNKMKEIVLLDRTKEYKSSLKPLCQLKKYSYLGTKQSDNLYSIGKVLITYSYKPEDLDGINCYIDNIKFKLLENGFIVDVFGIEVKGKGTGTEEGHPINEDLYVDKKLDIVLLLIKDEYLLWLDICHNNPPDYSFINSYGANFGLFCGQHGYWKDTFKLARLKPKLVERIHSMSCYSMDPYYYQAFYDFLTFFNSTYWTGYDGKYLLKYENYDITNWISDWMEGQKTRKYLIEYIPEKYKPLLGE